MRTPPYRHRRTCPWKKMSLSAGPTATQRRSEGSLERRRAAPRRSPPWGGAARSAVRGGALTTPVANARRLVVKVGSSLVTNDGRGLDGAAVAAWAAQIAELKH